MIPLVKVAMPPKEKLMPALEKVLYGGVIGEGQHVYEFEHNFAANFHLKTVVATSSGTAALHMALILAGARPGVEVITTSMTAEPTNTTILNSGATPVFADVDPCTGNLCPDAVEAKITARTVAIIVVHYAGYPAQLVRLRGIADKYGIKLIEDCAHALGATCDKQSVATYGDYAIFSFQAIKHMTTVDGGMLVLRAVEDLEKAKELRWFGLKKGVPRTEVDIKSVGFKYNMHNVAGVIGNVQLEHINPLISRHKENGRYFDTQLAAVPGISSARIDGNSTSSYWLYTLLVDDYEDIKKCMTDINVEAAKLHRPNHLHSIFRSFSSELPELQNFYRRLIHIPCGWWVTDSDRELIVSALRRG